MLEKLGLDSDMVFWKGVTSQVKDWIASVVHKLEQCVKPSEADLKIIGLNPCSKTMDLFTWV